MAISRTPNADATAVAVRNGRTRIKSVTMYQRSASAPALYLQIFDTNSPTVGTTAPAMVLQIHAGQSEKQGRQKVIVSSERGGHRLATGLSYAVTTTPTGSTNPATADRPLIDVAWEPA